MKLILKSISLKNFKGCKEAEYKFDGNTKVKGANGSGKSTLFNSFVWLFSDVDSKLVKNPDVVPIGMTECNPTVEIELEVDGKDLTVCKSQKFKRKEVDGKITSSTTNSYSINGVEYTQTNFIKNLEDRGIDMEHFLYLVHPEAFLLDTSAKGREKIRTILFGMIGEVSDKDIAQTLSVPEVKTLLEDKGYTIEEIESMAKSSLKKINDKYGKQNELIDSRIQGVMDSKVQVDVAELEKNKFKLMAEIEQLDKTIADSTGAKADIQRDIAKLELQREDILRQANAENEKAIAEKDRKIVELDTQRASVMSHKNVLNVEIGALQMEIERVKESLENYRGLYKKVQDEVLNENDLKCPTCGREYEADRIDEIKTQFEESKNERLNAYKVKGEELNKTLEIKESERKSKESQIADADKEYDELSKQIESIKAEISMMPTKADSSVTTDIDGQIKSLEEKLSTTDDSAKEQLLVDKKVKENQLKEINDQIAIAGRNVELDAQISSLREEKKQAEIERARQEKILDEVNTFIQEKNNLLTSNINEKFSMVDWHLYEYQKNGQIKPVCEPYIDGKPMTSAANGSLITLCKVSICSDLQKAFGVQMPIWIEDYSLFSSNTESRINTDSQIIGLVVTEDKEIKIECLS